MDSQTFELNGERILSVDLIADGAFLEGDDGQGIAIPAALLPDVIAALRALLPIRACIGCGRELVPDYGPRETPAGPLHWSCPGPTQDGPR